jgi:hypothetical protein
MELGFITEGQKAGVKAATANGVYMAAKIREMRATEPPKSPGQWDARRLTRCSARDGLSGPAVEVASRTGAFLIRPAMGCGQGEVMTPKSGPLLNVAQVRENAGQGTGETYYKHVKASLRNVSA